MTVSMPCHEEASPLVGEVGGGPVASATEESLCSPPPNPPHQGEGLSAQSAEGVTH
jgi:hypothetical protein